MSESKMENLKVWLDTQGAKKLGLWLILSLLLSTIFFLDFWKSLPVMLNPDWILQYHAAPWGVLLLCFIFLWVKRKSVDLNSGLEIKNSSTSLRFAFRSLNVILGAGLVVGAVFIPPSQDYIVFRVLLMALGVFVGIFGRGAKIPAIIVAVYGFAISFPLAIQNFAGDGYARSALIPLLAITKVLGLPIQNNGQWIYFTSTSGEPISATVTVACAGSVTMGVFIALYALMALDRPLPRHKAVKLFFIGAIGTWLQSIIRLVILLLFGYYVGNEALWSAHYWTIYILFPLWYLLFVIIYFRQFGKPAVRGSKPRGEYRLAEEGK